MPDKPRTRSVGNAPGVSPVKFTAFVRENGAEKIQGVYLGVALETAKERNRSRERQVPEYAPERMETSIREFPPGLSDGFDPVFTLDEIDEPTEVQMSLEEKEIRHHF